MERGRALRVRAQNFAREASPTGTGLDHEERVGLLLLTPTAVELARDASAEQWADFGTRDEVASGAARAAAGREEAGRRFVQSKLDEPVERDRALAPDQASDRCDRPAGTAGQNARSPIRAKSCG